MAVGLGQHERDSSPHRGEADGSGDVAAAAHHRRRPQLVEQPSGGAHGGGGLQQRTDGLERVRAAQPLDVDLAQLEAGLRHELALGPLAPDEDDARAVSPQLAGHRQRRHHVPGRPARCDHVGRPGHQRGIVPDRARR